MRAALTSGCMPQTRLPLLACPTPTTPLLRHLLQINSARPDGVYWCPEKTPCIGVGLRSIFDQVGMPCPCGSQQHLVGLDQPTCLHFQSTRLGRPANPCKPAVLA